MYNVRVYTIYIHITYYMQNSCYMQYFILHTYEQLIETYSPVNLCIKREVIPNKGIPLPRCSDRSPETPPKFLGATPIWIMRKFRDFKTFNNISHVGYQMKALDVRNHKNVLIWHLSSHNDHTHI